MNKPNLTLDEMIDCLHNPKGKRSLAELDDVIDEIIARNPDWVEEISRIVEEKRNERTNSRTC
jgi:hypothetical protein